MCMNVMIMFKIIGFWAKLGVTILRVLAQVDGHSQKQKASASWEIEESTSDLG